MRSGIANAWNTQDEEKAAEPRDDWTIAITVQINDTSNPIDLNPFLPNDEADDRATERVIGDTLRNRNLDRWATLGTYNVTDTHAVVKVSYSHTAPFLFADAVRWTYLGDADAD